VVGLETPTGQVVEFPDAVNWNNTLFWLDEQHGVLLLIPRTGNDLLRVDLATGTVEHLDRLNRVGIEEFLNAQIQPDPDGTAVVQYDLGHVKLDCDGRVRMHQLLLEPVGTSRRWNPAELPALRGSAAECVVDAKETDPRPDASVAIELVAFFHGAFWYGLLGAVFTWAPGDCLTLTVRADGGQPMAGSLAWAPRRPEGKAAFGLPEECVGSVVRGFGAGAAKVGDLPGGSLSFDYAAYGNVGPSTDVFHGLAAVLTQLVLGQPRPWYIALCDELGLHYDS
jgi:hypothetical protein